jgi:hypothetical protein
MKHGTNNIIVATIGVCIAMAIIVTPILIGWGIVHLVKLNDTNIARSATQYELCILEEYGHTVEACREANGGVNCVCNAMRTMK